MDWWWVAVGFVAAYLLGSVNTSILVSRLAGRGDVRRAGSGNPGATNTLRLLGRGWALAVLAIDAGRGAGVFLLAAWLLDGPWQPYAVAFGVVLGNLLPVFHRFRGGKGVATTLGLYLAIAPAAAGLGLAVWLAVVALTRYASLGSLCLVVAYPGWLALLDRGWGAIGLGLVMIAVVAATHRANIGRLLAGEEHKVGADKADKKEAPPPRGVDE